MKHQERSFESGRPSRLRPEGRVRREATIRLELDLPLFTLLAGFRSGGAEGRPDEAAHAEEDPWLVEVDGPASAGWWSRTEDATGASPHELIMTRPVYGRIVEALGSVAPEAGGILLGPRDSGLVTHYRHDDKAMVTEKTFTPDIASLNAFLRGALDFGLDVKGIVHSHPPGVPHPSGPDIDYVLKAFQVSSTPEFLMPIFCDGQLHPYVITRDAVKDGRRATGRSLPRAILVLI